LATLNTLRSPAKRALSARREDLRLAGTKEPLSIRSGSPAWAVGSSAEGSLRPFRESFSPQMGQRECDVWPELK
jgi:hypothetical protein